MINEYLGLEDQELSIINNHQELFGEGRTRIGRREKWPKKSWEEGEEEKLGVGRIDLDEETKSREEGEIGSETREKGDLLPCSSPL